MRTAEAIYQEIRADSPGWWGGFPGEVTESVLRAIADVCAALEDVDETLHRRLFLGLADGRWLDEHGLERRIYRLDGESDESFRARLHAIEDVVTPSAIVAGVERVLRFGPAVLLEYQTSGAFFDYSYYDTSLFWPASPPYFILRIPPQVDSRADRSFVVPAGGWFGIHTFFGAGGSIVDAQAVAAFFENDALVGDPIYRAIYETARRLRAAGVQFHIEVLEDIPIVVPPPSGPIFAPQAIPNADFDLFGVFDDYTGAFWYDELQVNEAIANGPWRIGGSAALSPAAPGGSGDFAAISRDTTSARTTALNEEYALVSDPFSIVDVPTARIDAGDLSLDLTCAITRRTGQVLDECRLGVYWLDAADGVISSAQSPVIGTAEGLAVGWADFTRSFAMPPLTRKFQVRLIAIRRDPAGTYAALQFDQVRVHAVA